ncbi:MAG: hypothetical protein ACO3FA_00490 [Vulcanococcus sp.]
MNSPELRSAAGLVLVAPGGCTDMGSGARLAALLGLQLLMRIPAPEQDPAAVLDALARQAPGWLLPLPVDPGQELTQGGCWAETLAAWRQPALLLLPEQAPAGAPRAYHALLQCAGVPLLGLVQLGGAWAPELRRRDGLPWLGWLPATAAPGVDPAQAGDDAAVALRAACRLRWREISAARPVAPPLHPPAAAARPA